MATFDYSFSTEDLTGPTIVSVQARTLTTVRVTFDEAMGADASEVASYSLVLSTVDQTRLPAVRGEDIVVESVTRVSDTEFDLALDMEPTPRALYSLTATASDTNGNSASNTATFTGYQPIVDSERRYDYLAWLPDMNVAEDDSEELTHIVRACQEVGELLLYEADRFPEYLDPDLAPISYVDAMLCDLGNPFEFDLSDSDKRRLVKILRAIYSQKGTDVGIINAVRLFLSLEITITSPYKTDAFLGRTTRLGVAFNLSTDIEYDLYTMQINVPEVLTDDQLKRLGSIIAFMRRAPCHWRIAAPTATVVIDHWALGRSRLGTESNLHS